MSDRGARVGDSRPRDQRASRAPGTDPRRADGAAFAEESRADALSRPRRHTLEAIVFVAGAVTMMVEIAGARVLAPFFGSSLVTWTSLIGVMLASLSAGYWWGGVLADKRPSQAMLGGLLFAAGLATALIPTLKGVLLPSLAVIRDLRVTSLLGSVVLFAPASAILGMIPPYAAKLALTDLETSGAVVGRLSAFAAAGSIVGTFLTGYVLLALVGNTILLLLLAAVLVLTSFVALAGRATGARLVALVAILSAVAIVVASARHDRGGASFDTAYNWYEVYELQSVDQPAGQAPRRMRVLSTDKSAIQSAMYLDSDELPIPYTRYYRLSEHFVPDARRVLLIGGGAYTVARDFLRHNPTGRIDVVEIDPDLTAIAKRYFALRDDPRLRIVNEDGRTFVNRPGDVYDAIYVDAFNDSFAIPYQLTTKELVQRLWEHLADRGVVIVNLVSAISGEHAQFLQAEYATYATTFPQVFAFAIETLPPTDWQNVVLVARKAADPPRMNDTDPELDAYLGKRIQEPAASDAPILTDDFAPVDQYLLKAAL